MPREPVPAPPGPKPPASPAPPPPLARQVRRPSPSGVSGSPIGLSPGPVEALPPGWAELDQLARDVAEVREILAACRHPDHIFRCVARAGWPFVQAGRVFVSCECMALDSTMQISSFPLESPVVRWGRGWFVTKPIIPYEVAHIAYKLVEQSARDEVRRAFTLDGEAIFDKATVS